MAEESAWAAADAAEERPLGGCRVVELPGAEPALFGKTFADLGAEVIKVEPPDGDPGRTLPPFAPDGSSLYWGAYAAGKWSVTAALKTDAGRDLLHRLAVVADIVVGALPAGWLEAPGGLGAELVDANPALVLVAISPFGQRGPYASWRGSDLVQFALSGYLYMTGPPDGAPLKPSAPYQTWFHGCMHAVAATLLALRARRKDGRGALIDQAMRDTGLWMLTHTCQFWDLLGVNLKRQGASRDMGGVLRLPSVWRARDGYIVWMFQTGHIGGERMRLLVEWMAAHGMAPDWLQEIRWDEFDLLTALPEMHARLTAAFAAFFATKTKAELFTWALPRGVMLAPVQTLSDVAADPQLAARGAWRPYAGIVGAAPPAAGTRMPGPPVCMSGARWEPRGPAPALGAHNARVYGGLLGLSADAIAALAAAGAI
jgi:benzylsuccinate CoA-transferase BbsE subunit